MRAVVLAVSLAVPAAQEVFLRQTTRFPIPTPGQIKLMDMGLAVFMHFGVNPWTNTEHNCIGSDPACILSPGHLIANFYFRP